MREWSHAQGEPETVLAVLQDHGENDGGWGPATVFELGQRWPKPLVTSRDNPENLAYMKELAAIVAQQTGKRTKLVRFRREEELLSIGGSS